MNDTKTEWFLVSEHNPARVGVYEVRTANHNHYANYEYRYSLWDGKKWRNYFWNPISAAKAEGKSESMYLSGVQWRGFVEDLSGVQWRGFVKEQK